MRSGERDHGGTIQFGGHLVDAASGSGVAQPGSIPWTFTRTAPGSYTINFDTALTVLAVSAVPTTAIGNQVSCGGVPGAGTFITRTFDSAGTASNATHDWTCTARDGRR
jgi:hypothetical protein